ncbi:hypothetical protein [Brassicibacter mesophilus]|uniref:hypothetical protein n=1 Tax=Brassicibacter mesophilus TaxID=745119 RepID=UPI003D2325E1
MFYDKEIEIIGNTGQLNDSGRWVDGEDIVVKTIDCDVQSYSKQLAYKDYAFNEDVKYRVFCDPEPLITLGTSVSYQEPFKDKKTVFSVVNIIPWDSCWEVMIDD